MRTKWRKKRFNYKTVLRFEIENREAIKTAQIRRFSLLQLVFASFAFVSHTSLKLNFAELFNCLR
jgi:hypothetical protein